MLRRAVLCLAGGFAFLAAAFSGALGSIPVGIIAFALCLGAYRAFYWISYTSAAEHPSPSYLREILIALSPAIAGLGLTQSTHAVWILLVVAALLALLSTRPLARVLDSHEVYSWSFRETFHNLFLTAHHTSLIRSLLDGFEAGALFLIWPIAAFMLFGWSYSLLGVVFALTLLLTLLIRHVLKNRHPLTDTPLIHASIVVSAWLIRGLIATPIGVLAVDSYAHGSTRPSSRGIDIATGEQSAENHTYVDELTALKEVGQGLGRLFLCLLAVTMIAIFPLYVALIAIFALAAACATFSIYLAQHS